MTNYETSSYVVEDFNDESITYETLPAPEPGTVGADIDAPAVLKVWRTAFLPDGQPISLSVEHTLEDIRGLQAWLNDKFGAGRATGRYGITPPAVQDLPPSAYRSEPGEPYVTDPAMPQDVETSGLDFYDPTAVGVPVQPNYTPGPEVYGMAEPSDFYGGAADAANIRQCPVIYNGVQCSKADYHVNSVQTAEHTFFTDAPVNEMAPVQIPYNGGDQTLRAAEEQFEQEHPSVPATAAAEPVKKTSTRRKKEEIAYDKALETFRAQPDSQLNYTDLVKAADALRNRFPDAQRLVAYDLHIQHQDVTYLTDPAMAGSAPIPAQTTPPEQRDPVAGRDYMSDSSPVPHFAPEQNAPAAFVPPVEMQPADVQSPEELQAAQAFPCQFRSETSGRQCTRPAGHDLANPPKPHIFAALEQGQSLPAVPNFVPPAPFQPPAEQVVGTPGFTVSPVGQGQGFTQSTIPPFQIPQPATQTQQVPGQQQLSFQVPPTPEAEHQPPAPAAPWGPSA